MTAAGVLHMRIRNGRKRYRFWSSVVDAYITEECSERQAMNFIKDQALKQAEEDAKRAIERADRSGSSSYPLAGDVPIGVEGPWRRQRCAKHAIVHHKFERGAFSEAMGLPRCRSCGEGPEHKTHADCNGG